MPDDRAGYPDEAAAGAVVSGHRSRGRRAPRVRGDVPAVDASAGAGDRTAARRIRYCIEPLHARSQTRVVFIVDVDAPAWAPLITFLANNESHAEALAFGAINLLESPHQ